MEQLEPGFAEEFDECPRCGEELSIPPETEISLVLYRHRADCITNGFYECSTCGKNLPATSKDQIPAVLHQHRVDCYLYVRKQILNALLESAKDERKALDESEVTSDKERRAQLEQTISECKKSLGNLRVLRKEAEVMFKRVDASELERAFEAERGHPRGTRRPLHIEVVEGKPRLFTDTPKEFRDQGWEWLQDNEWRRPEYLREGVPFRTDYLPDGTFFQPEYLPVGTPVWAYYPSKKGKDEPDPNDPFVRYTLRNEPRKRRRNIPDWSRSFERIPELRRRHGPKP